MNTHYTIRISSIVACIILLLVSISTRADDIDIYVAPDASIPPQDAPKVMLTLDWRPNVISSNVCTGSECDFLVEEEYLDSTPTTYFNLLRAVLERVLSSLSGVQVGIMLNHAHEQGCVGPNLTGNKAKCSNGGYVLKGFTSVDDEEGMADLFTRLYAIPDNLTGSGHSYQGSELFFELFRYLTGQGIFNGHNGWTDFQTNNSNNLDSDFGGALMWDTAIENGANYISPLTGSDNSCGNQLYTINFLFQVANQEADSNDAILELKNAGGMEGINLDCNKGRSSSAAGEFGCVLRYLHQTDLADGTWGTAGDVPGTQSVTSYFVVHENSVNNTTIGYAEAGGTDTPMVLSDDPRELISTLEGIFEQILSVSTTFVTGSLPVDVFNRIDYIDDVYLAIFRADPEARPFWNGNLKKLKLIEEPIGNPVLVDALGNLAINPLDGRINNTALSFWTDPDHVPAPPEDETDWTLGRDGRATNQGGGGAAIPGFLPELGYSPGLENDGEEATASGPRRLYTDPSGTAGSFVALNANPTTATNLIAANNRLFKTVMPDADCAPSTCTSYETSNSATQQVARDRMIELLAFARGFNDSNGTDKRSWFMGDPLHSRPRPINYGGPDAESQDVRILMATNDGFLHMFDADTGIENWAFMPQEVMPTLKILKQNSPNSTPIHPYTIDSTASTLVVDANQDNLITANDGSGDLAIAVIGMRRGGKQYYAIDITDPDDPAFLWRIGPDRLGFAQIGQTWSVPSPIRLPVDIDGNPNTTDWGFIFAGGYNGDDSGDGIPDEGETHLGKDERDATSYFADPNDEEGNAMYIVDAMYGELIWKATGPGPDIQSPSTGTSTSTSVSSPPSGYNYNLTHHFQHADMVDSIAADMAVADVVTDGIADRAYVGDTGGVIWRVDFLEQDPAEWTVTRLFSSGRHYSADTTNDRRHHHGFDIVRSRDAQGPFIGVVATTGNRPHPLSKDTQDYVYLIKDRVARNSADSLPVDSDLNHGQLADLTDNCLQNPSVSCEPDLSQGWRIGLSMCPTGSEDTWCGEKGLSRPITVLGVIRFTTYIPPDTSDANLSCEPREGTGARYAIRLQDATALFDFDATNNTGDTIQYDRATALRSGGIPSDPVVVGSTSDGKLIWMDTDNNPEVGEENMHRTYWYQDVNQ